MADDLRRRMERIDVKTRMVLERYEKIRAERDALLARLNEAEADNLALRTECEKLTREVSYMKMASSIAPDPEARERARKTIAGLIADIDKCIADIRD